MARRSQHFTVSSQEEDLFVEAQYTDFFSDFYTNTEPKVEANGTGITWPRGWTERRTVVAKEEQPIVDRMSRGNPVGSALSGTSVPFADCSIFRSEQCGRGHRLFLRPLRRVFRHFTVVTPNGIIQSQRFRGRLGRGVGTT